jgi:hypothetical protein
MRALALALTLLVAATSMNVAASVDAPPPEVPCASDPAGCEYHLLGCAFILFTLDLDQGFLGRFVECVKSTGA